MPIDVTMPRLSDTMEQGTVVKWHVHEGQQVKSGDVIADVETDKATMELQVYDDGTVAKIAVPEGQLVAVGTTILTLEAEGASPAATKASSSEAAPAAKATAKASAGGVGAPPSGGATAVADRTERTGAHGGAASAARATNGAHGGPRVFASPLARKIADERGVDLSALAGSGPSGRIVRKDVEAAATTGATTSLTAPRRDGGSRSVQGAPAAAAAMPAPSASLESRSVPLSGMRATIARRLVESKTTIPHYQVTVSARMDALLGLREQLNEQLEPQGIKLSVNDFLVRACALAMHEHPFVNSSWNPQGPAIELHGRVHIGVAIALPAERGGGLVVATIRDADRHGLRHISAETKRLAAKAREKGLSIEDMADSTFTISNLGMFGVDHFTAIINPPNVAILAVGRAIQKPFIEIDDDDEASLVVGHEMAMTMSSDHRVVDGAMAAAYLSTVQRYLEQPASLLV